MSYSDFLATKRRVESGNGISVSLDSLPSPLYDWQKQLVRWALRKGRAAIWADCGLGKTFMQVAWAQAIGERVLILAPLCVAEQTVHEAAKLGIAVRYAVDHAAAGDAPIVITNYERLDKFDPAVFGGVVLDECFAPDTHVDVLSIDGTTNRKYIKDIQVGENILNASGVDLVADVHRREVSYAVKVSIGEAVVTCSPNHPWFTRRGWVGAQDLVPGDEVMATAEAMRVVREALHAGVCAGGEEAVLQSILLSEMADVATGDPGEGACAGGGEEARREPVGVAAVGASECEAGDRADYCAQPDGRSDGAAENLPRVESDEARTFRAWGQWPWLDRAAADAAGCTRVELAGGVQFVAGPTDSGLSDALQDRHLRAQSANRYRSGWILPLQPQDAGREEGRKAAFTRVDRLEVLEQGHPELEQWRDADGRIYFYDLGATRHPSYSIGGLLVHNSSILKAFDGATRTALIRAFANTRYRLCCTATPSPNDIAELANHAEFLGLMTRVEFLATWFVKIDQGLRTIEHHGWRLKRHAVEPFYRWLASWAVALRSPSDLGFDGTGYYLPPLHIHDAVVESTAQPEGVLFADMAVKGIGGRLRARRASIDARVAETVALVSRPGQWIVWCGLNPESEAVAAGVPDAVEVTGSDAYAVKVSAVERFVRGDIRVLVSKSRILGLGMNFHHCHQMVFLGLNDSYESYYQCLRRAWRYGQQHPVDAYIVVSDAERAIVENVRRKEATADTLARNLLRHMARFERAEITA